MVNHTGKTDTARSGRTAGTLCIWSADPIAHWIVQAIHASGVAVVSVGSPLTTVRNCLGIEDGESTDLRVFSSAMRGIPLLFVGFGDADARAAVASNHPIVFTTEPWIGRFDSRNNSTAEVSLPGFAIDGRLWQAGEIFSQSASPDIAQISSLGSTEHGSILARIQEASTPLIRWMGVPERVSASVGGPRIQRSWADQPDSASRSMRLWTGSFALTCQYSDGRAGLIMASNQHPAWTRSALACGSFGAVRVDDATLQWRDPSNELLENTLPSASEWASTDLVSIAAHTLATALDELSFTRAHHEKTRAFMEAACLSAFTLESESPFKLAEILGDA